LKQRTQQAMNTKVKKRSVQSQLDQALALQHAGDVDAAESIFQQVLKADARNPAALYSMAAIESSKKNYAKALTYIQPVVVSNPGFAQAHLALSVILFNLGDFEKSLGAAEKAMALEPALQNAQSHLQTVQLAMQVKQANTPAGVPEVILLNNQAIALQNAGEHAHALELLTRSLAMAPMDFTALYSMGISHSALGHTQQALDCFSKSAEAAPHMAISHFAKAKTYQDFGMAETAIACYDQAIAVDPKYMEAYANKAAILQAINRHHDALLTLIAATDIDPNNVRALEGQGQILGQYKQYGMSTNAFLRALQIDPLYNYGEGHLMSARLGNCDWTDFEGSRQRIFEGIRAGRKACGAMTIMSISDDAALARQSIETYAADKYGPSIYKLWDGEPYAHRRKRVAFISGDFRVHPVGYLLIGMLEKFDKTQFELTGVFTGTPDGSDLWKRYRCVFDHYLEVKETPSLEVAKILRAMEIDIAIDLSGHTEGTRLEVLSHRPAPVQATYLGFPGTLGLAFIDYLIADPRIIPPDLQHHYREKVLYLPHCYLPRDNSVVPSPETPQRRDFGLPETGIVFCSFNHDYKINPPIFKVWMDLLKQVPGSVLWLMKLNDGAHVNLTNSAIAHGVDPERIVYATRLPRIEDHLARYRLADIFLDTYPYNGHTTAGDALRAGLPVVSLCGESFASRVAASLLHDVGLPQYACTTLEDYQATALRMATNEGERHDVVAHLAHRINEAQWPPSDESQAKALMQVLHEMQVNPS
jgi:protein O-GlcNAc transferase